MKSLIVSSSPSYGGPVGSPRHPRQRDTGRKQGTGDIGIFLYFRDVASGRLQCSLCLTFRGEQLNQLQLKDIFVSDDDDDDVSHS